MKIDDKIILFNKELLLKVGLISNLEIRNFNKNLVQTNY
jgi:hypothetical protein